MKDDNLDLDDIAEKTRLCIQAESEITRDLQREKDSYNDNTQEQDDRKHDNKMRD